MLSLLSSCLTLPFARAPFAFNVEGGGPVVRKSGITAESAGMGERNDTHQAVEEPSFVSFSTKATMVFLGVLSFHEGSGSAAWATVGVKASAPQRGYDEVWRVFHFTAISFRRSITVVEMEQRGHRSMSASTGHTRFGRMRPAGGLRLRALNCPSAPASFPRSSL